jgi:hypothetical protein
MVVAKNKEEKRTRKHQLKCKNYFEPNSGKSKLSKYLLFKNTESQLKEGFK